MESSSLHLWFAYPDDLLDAGLQEKCVELLASQERERWQRFRFPRHQREYLATRALLRSALSQLRPTAPASWNFGKNNFGKPFVEPDCGLRFNLSNSNGLVVCLISEESEVGVDVEATARSNSIMDVAERVFSAAELAQLKELEAAAKLDRALSLWTLKEAYIKARGMGLSLPLEKISFLFGGSPVIRLETEVEADQNPGRWRFCSMDYADHRVSAVVESKFRPQLSLWEARPLLAPAQPLKNCNIQWYPCA